jgi:hypothetical protein
MISCMVSVAWSHHVLSFCCTEHSPYRGAVLTDHITSVAMSSSCQLDRCCTVETHCSDMHVYRRFNNTRACLKNTRACLLGQLIVSLFPWSTARQGPLDTWQHQSSPLNKTEPEAVRHMVAPELTLSRRQGPEPRDTWQHRSSPQQRGEVQGRGTRGGTEAHLCSEPRYRAARHMMALDPNSAEMCDLKLQLMWQRVDTHHAP